MIGHSPLLHSDASTDLPADIHGGVHHNLFAPDTVTFALRAPHKPYVSLVGDFNGWDTRANPLVTDGRGTWWTTLRTPSSTRYGYFVAVDEQAHAWVGDPYATELRWDNRSAWAYLAQRPQPFMWSDGGWCTPPLRELVIYELNVRDFAGCWEHNRPRYGSFSAMLAQIDYLADLGVNAIELMPIQAFPGESSWGYNPVFYFAPAAVYGTPDELRLLVDRCHTKGLAVILDVAFNHAWGDHPYYHYYPPLYDGKGARLANWSPFFHHTPPSVNMWGGLDWDHFRPDTTRYFQDVIRHWLREYHVDGFRFDWVCGVDFDTRAPMSPGFDPYHGISAICWAARQEKPDCILIGEFWQLEGTHPDKTGAKLVRDTEMDAVWNGEFHHTLDDVLNQRWQWERNDIFRAIGGYRDRGFDCAAQVINYSCSHDEVRPEHEIKYYSGRYIERPQSLTLQEMALRKALLGLVVVMTAPGVPMIYAGQEYGEDSPRTIDFLPLAWQKLAVPQHARHAADVRRLIALRRDRAALRGDHIRFYVNHFDREKLVRYDRWDDAGDCVIVALNFAGENRFTWLDVPTAGTWVDVLSGVAYGPVDMRVDLKLEPWQAVVLVAKDSIRSRSNGSL